MFEKLPSKVHYPDIEKEILKFWKDNDIFGRSISERPDDKPFVFYEGPPTANGKPGVHHVISRTIKDLVCRYKTMQGYQVHRKAGWDTHGLPVEIEVEKQLGLNSKEKILDYGIEKFNKKCRESVFTYLEDWNKLTERIGFWVDLENPYVTYDNNYIESVWWILDQFFKKDYIYKGYKILPYCPRCETPLSSHEVSLGYKDVTDPSIYVKAKVKGEDNTYFLLWTTTPWTLISNVALVAHADLDYVYVKTKSCTLIMAKDRLEVLEESKEIIKTVKGSELAGMEYEQIFKFLEPDKKAFYVVLGDFVTAEDGSGIVHMAPAFGADDYNMGIKYDLPLMKPVDAKGNFTDEITDYKGQFVKNADKNIIKDLEKSGHLYRADDYLHSYPHCWRCSSPLLYYARDSWFISTSKFKDQLIKNNKEVSWQSKEMGEGRFHKWLENNIDWSLSRDRFWGTPLPIWVCECGKKESIGSIEELVKRSKNEISPDIDLHKPYIDDVLISCSDCGEDMQRTPEVIDCWFDSGAMPYAQWHYPFENKEKFEKSFPADFISEAVDQTRGWFYSLLAISTLLFDSPAYKSCLCMDLILDKNGQKMSKSKGNTVDPNILLENEGADAIRWYFISSSPPWQPTKFDRDGVNDVIKKFFGTLTNTYTFFETYANIDNFSYKNNIVPVTERPEIDRWLLSSLAQCVEKVNNYMDKYEITKASRVISDFVGDDLSNWYVRLNRRRFWKSENGEDKNAAYQTLYEALVTTCKLMAPIAPFLSEKLFRNLRTWEFTEKQSVHLEMFPLPSDDMFKCRDNDLVEKMILIRRVCFLARSMRSKFNLKIRQPLSELIIAPVNDRQVELLNSGKDFILSELNIKEIKFVTDEGNLIIKSAKPNFRALGPKLGKNINLAKTVIAEIPSDELTKFENGETIEIEVAGSKIELNEGDIEIVTSDMPGLISDDEFGMKIGINTELTEELVEEGFSREIVNRIQNMRKEADFDVVDRISLYVSSNENVIKLIKKQENYISKETLSDNVMYKEADGDYSKSIEINGDNIKIGIERIK